MFSEAVVGSSSGEAVAAAQAGGSHARLDLGPGTDRVAVTSERARRLVATAEHRSLLRTVQQTLGGRP